MNRVIRNLNTKVCFRICNYCPPNFYLKMLMKIINFKLRIHIFMGVCMFQCGTY